MGPAEVIAAVEAGITVATWIEGVIERHKAGQAPAASEAAVLLVLGDTLAKARAENDASDQRLDQALDGQGGPRSGSNAAGV